MNESNQNAELLPCPLCQKPMQVLENGLALCRNLIENPDTYVEWAEGSCMLAVHNTQLPVAVWQALNSPALIPVSTTPAEPSLCPECGAENGYHRTDCLRHPKFKVPEPWVVKLYDGGDGVKGHYCIGRWNPAGYHEFWFKDKFCSAGEVFVGKAVAEAKLQLIAPASPLTLPAEGNTTNIPKETK